MAFRLMKLSSNLISLPRKLIYRPLTADTTLKDVLRRKIPEERESIKDFRSLHGDLKIGDIRVNHIYSGMRGMLGLVWETSHLDPQEGIRFRDMTIDEVRSCLPAADEANEPMVEGLLWLLVTGDVPNQAEALALSAELAQRAKMPPFVEGILKACHPNMHPMTIYSMLMTAMSNTSKFKEAYSKGIKKSDYWQFIYEDCMDLIASAPLIAGRIYSFLHLKNRNDYEWNPEGDLAQNFANTLNKGSDINFVEFLRLYMLLHSDHEGGNVSAHAVNLVGSALSDPYLSYAAGLNGLAGPLHGLATQETLLWVRDLQIKHGMDPSVRKVVAFIQDTLAQGKVIPGYGHAVLRKTDPRFTAQMNFAKQYGLDSPTIRLVARLHEIVPPILQATGKVTNPWPNVDAHSGALLKFFDIDDLEYYTVMFGVSRAIGVMANTIWSRAIGLPIERPKSISSFKLKELAREQMNTKVFN